LGASVSEHRSERSWQLAPAAHRLLIAAPTLSDPEFFRTVVFLIEHDDTGTVGVIINRPSHTPVGHILPDWQDVMSEPAVVFNGGPVQRDGALGLGRLSGSTDAGTGLRAVSGGLALVDLDAEASAVSLNAQSLRVFAGHAGWEIDQLDSEIAGGGWFVVAGGLDDVFSEHPGTLWRSVLRRQPTPLSLLSTYPVDVGLN
jgi:putative transcriptional regulator